MRKALLVVVFFSACSPSDCERFAAPFRAKECNLIVSHLPSAGRRFNLRGIHAVTHEKTRYLDQDAWHLTFNHRIAAGDTVVKRRGETSLAIHKKDTVLRYTYRCEEKTYHQ